MSNDTVWDAYGAGKPLPEPRPFRARMTIVGSSTEVTGGPLILTPARLPDPKTIPPREWLYGTQLIRGFVSVLVAPGGTGKSSYAMVMAAALAIGRKLLGEHVFQQTNVAVFNLEDPMEELERRLAAIQIKHEISNDELAGRYFLNAGQDRPLVMACLDDQGYSVIHPDEDTLVQQILANNIGLIVCDPFAESHSLEENNNPQMVRAAAAWRRVARLAHCAILLVHHVRKGPTLDIDSARGAKALTDSARVGLLMSSMSPEDAEHLGVPEGERSLYARLDDAKANMAPRAGKARWFHLERVNLGNYTVAYPKGDFVAAIVAWEPPSLWANASSLELNRALDILSEPQAGMLYSPTKAGANNKRWAGNVLVDVLGCNEKQAASMIAEWLKNGLLVTDEYFDDSQRKKRTGVRVVDALRPS